MSCRRPKQLQRHTPLSASVLSGVCLCRSQILALNLRPDKSVHLLSQAGSLRLKQLTTEATVRVEARDFVFGPRLLERTLSNSPQSSVALWKHLWYPTRICSRTFTYHQAHRKSNLPYPRKTLGDNIEQDIRTLPPNLIDRLRNTRQRHP